MKKFVLFLICTILTISLYSFKVDAVNFHREGDNDRYFVGMMYFDTWLHADGKTWQNNISPITQSPITKTQNYSFNFLNRRVKSVTVTAYNGMPAEYIENSRNESWSIYELESSTNVSPTTSNQNGIGTSEISFTVTVNANLNAERPLDIRHLANSELDENTEGYRTFLPILIKVELEPESNAPKTSIMSTFNNYTINRQAPKNQHTFWMYHNSDSSDTFIVEIRSQKLTSGGWLEREIHPLREIIFDSNRKLNIIGFNSDGTPIDVTVWRKGKERTDLSDTFKNQFFRGYTREQNGGTYYYYQHYQSTADGELYPTSQLLNYVPNANILDYLSRFGLHNLEDYEYRIMNP